MSLKQSLEVLNSKIIQKNIILVSGNIDDILPSYFLENNESSIVPTKLFNIKDYIKEMLKINPSCNLSTLKYFSPSQGILDLLNSNKNTNNNSNNEKNDFDDFDEQENNISGINEFINEITSSLSNKEETYTDLMSLYIIECSEIFLDKSGNGITPAKLSELISNFTRFNSGNFISALKNNKKLILLARNPETITNFVPVNNLEFSSIVISKPNKDERNEFFKSFKKLFDIKETFNDPDHDDYKEALVISDGLSFKEIMQLAKFKNDNVDKPTFKQLYNMANFNRQNSEWEKLDIKSLRNINNVLSNRVKGQKPAIDAIEKTLIRSFTGLNGITQSSNSKKPKGVLFLAGPTGTGKTEISKTLCSFVFGDESRLIRFDMSEYNHEHSDQRLIGAPPGYIGYDAGGQLTSAIKNKPFSILLFDEIEKAHPKILDKFLQILEDGRLTSSQGETIDFSETFIIFTSNIGTSDIDSSAPEIEIRNKFIKAVEKYFKNELKRPEILNRIGVKNIIPFNFITDENIIREIIDMKIKNIIKKIKDDKKINCIINNETINNISISVMSKYDRSLGGRGIVTELETEFIDNLSFFIFNNYEKIIENKNNNKYSNISIGFENNRIIFNL